MTLTRNSQSPAPAWAPMAIPAFRVLWFAQLGSNIGTWMQTVGAQWYLVEASAGAVMIALVQTVSLAPAIVLSLPSGVLADSLDRRKLLAWGSAASALIALILTGISSAEALTPWTILAITLLLGVTATLTSPAWQAIQPELVPRHLIAQSSALGSITVNAARAVGPALAGVILSIFGAPVVFGLNALSFVGAAAALLWWKRPPQPGLDDREPFTAALRAGLRYAKSAALVRRILLRAALFALPGSALWALLPLTAERLNLDSAGYGLLLGALGVGAVAGVFVLPSARKLVSDTTILMWSAALFGVATFAAGYWPVAAVLATLVLGGLAWIGTLTVLNASLQLTLAQWVRSRGLSTYILVFMGTMAVGSWLWGVLAQNFGASVSLLAAALVLSAVALSALTLPLLPGTGQIDRTVSLTWAEPRLQFLPAPTDGPVLVQVTYQVREESAAAFVAAMRSVEGTRRRTGGYRWALYRAGEHKDRYLETFMVPSWSEHRRQETERLTGRDRQQLNAVFAHSASTVTEHHYFPAPSASTQKETNHG